MCEVKVEFLLKERILFMKTKFKLTALVGALLMSLSACDWGILGPVNKTSKLENYPATYNPYNLATKHNKKKLLLLNILTMWKLMALKVPSISICTCSIQFSRWEMVANV